MSGDRTTFSIFSVQDHYPELPRGQGAFYREMLEQARLAEELGYDTYWVAEHHFHEYGVVPNPAVFLAAAAQCTSRIRLGSAVSVLPFRNPLLVAEDYAMVDLLSGGRLVLGVGSGYLKHEFEGFDIPPESKRERFDENLAVLREAWKGEPFTFEGKYNRIRGQRINVVSAQQPGPEIYVAVLRAEAAYHVGRAGNKMMSIPYATVNHVSECEQIVAEYERGWRVGGHPGEPPEIAFAFHTYVARDDATAKADAEEAFDNYVRTRLYGKSAGWDEIGERGYCLFGGVERVLGRLEQMRGLGINHILLLINFGALDHGKVMETMRRIAEEVIPNT